MIPPQFTLGVAATTILFVLNNVRKRREIDGFDWLILTLASLGILFAIVAIKYS